MIYDIKIYFTVRNFVHNFVCPTSFEYLVYKNYKLVWRNQYYIPAGITNIICNSIYYYHANDMKNIEKIDISKCNKIFKFSEEILIPKYCLITPQILQCLPQNLLSLKAESMTFYPYEKIQLMNLTELDLSFCTTTDPPIFIELNNLKKLKKLKTDQTDITDNCIDKLTNLIELSLRSCYKFKGLSLLSLTKLKYLDIGNNCYTNNLNDYFDNLIHLETLKVYIN